MMTGSGMALVFPTAAASVLASVRPSEAGKASGATNAIREIGGVMGVAVLASVFAANGSYESPQAFTAGVTAALPVAVVVLAIGAVLALLTGSRSRASEEVRLPAGRRCPGRLETQRAPEGARAKSIGREVRNVPPARWSPRGLLLVPSAGESADWDRDERRRLCCCFGPSPPEV